MLSQILTSHTIAFIMEKILPLLGDMEHDQHRQGACEALACILLFYLMLTAIKYLF